MRQCTRGPLYSHVLLTNRTSVMVTRPHFPYREFDVHAVFPYLGIANFELAPSKNNTTADKYQVISPSFSKRPNFEGAKLALPYLIEVPVAET